MQNLKENFKALLKNTKISEQMDRCLCSIKILILPKFNINLM